MTRRALTRARNTLLLAALVAVPLACGSASEPAIKLPPPRAIAKRCSTAAAGASAPFWFRASDGAIIDGAVLGHGRAGVVLASGWPGELCGELDYAQRLAGAGYRVLVFDFRSRGSAPVPKGAAAQNRYSADLAGAARQLRKRGVEEVFLLGESFGGTAVLAGAPKLDPAPAGVISLSGPASLSVQFGGVPDLDGVARARSLRSPLLILAARDDGVILMSDERELVRRAATRDKRLIVYPGAWHASELLYRAPYRAKVDRTILRFLAAHSKER